MSFKQVKASSLTNAIFICLLVSVFCGSIVLITHFKNRLTSILETNTYLINRNNSSFIYLINNLDSFKYNKKKEILFFDDNIKSIGLKKKWGFYNIIVCKTFLNTDTISKIALIGAKSKKTNIALFASDYNKSLQISGNVKVFGDLKIPNKKIEETFINGINNNQIKIVGNLYKSNKKIPKIVTPLPIDNKLFPTIFLNNTSKNNFSNDFDNETIVINLDGIRVLKNLSFKGNIILYTKEPLEIDSSVLLKDVIIMAPKIKVNSNFKGNIHLIANKTIEINQNAILLYPSSIYIKNDIDSVKVTLDKNSLLIGGIVIDANNDKNSLKRELKILENAKVIGDVYCFGKTQLQGEVIGTIYSDRFFLKTKTFNYENIILNATINNDSLPNSFIRLPLFNTKTKDYGVLKTF